MFDRLLKLISQDDLNKLNKTNVLLVGIGGVGGYALEALTRMGIENICIIDNDVIDLTNLNRQIISLNSNIGQLKVNVAQERCLDINPHINLNIKNDFLTKENIDNVLTDDYDYIIDACDTITTKVALIKFAKRNNIKIISCMGTGNRLDPTKLAIMDIFKTNYDPLAKVMRHLLREEKIDSLTVIASNEEPLHISSSIPGSSSLVPSVAGIYAASFVVNDILKK
jgi:tRNA threonylcarbamoyladenosine dehydratase